MSGGVGVRGRPATATVAQVDCEFLTLVGEFDAGGGLGWYPDFGSVAHWVSYYRSMAPGTAREHVRVADEDELCELALEMTASQLARTVRAFRGVDGTRVEAELSRAFTVREVGEGMTRVSVTLPTEEAALVVAAVARHYLDVTPAPAAEDDHHLVVVHVSAEVLAGLAAGGVPAGTCHIEGLGPIEPAVRIRDGVTCQFPGCELSCHLDAHHAVPWCAGGATDVDNLLNLCRRHHTAVHEGGMSITRQAGRWVFPHRDGTVVRELDPPTPGDLARKLITDSRIVTPHGGEGFTLDACVTALFHTAA